MAKFNNVFPTLRIGTYILTAVLSFLVGLVTLGVLLTPILAGLVILIIWNREGAKRAMPRLRKNIVIGAVSLILLAGLFPPYKAAQLDAEGNLIGTYVKWEFNKQLEDLIESVTEGHPVEMIEYMRRNDLLGIEILGILALAGSAYLISKKRRKS